jgi:hypothetical protein
MTYYQLSDDYELANKFLKEGATLPVWLTMESGGSSELFTASQPLEKELWLDGEFETDIIDFTDYCVRKAAQFLLPIPDPTIALQHSLTAALNECDELRNQVANWKAMCDGAYSACAELTTKSKEQESIISKLTESNRNYLASCDDESAQDYKGEIERLREALETVSSDAKVQIEGRDAALRGSAETFKDLSSKIAILNENLTRSESDRLAELTNIMRMVQALEDTPQDKRNGAIHLIKRVIYEQICRLDPSHSWDT